MIVNIKLPIYYEFIWADAPSFMPQILFSEAEQHIYTYIQTPTYVKQRSREVKSYSKDKGIEKAKREQNNKSRAAQQLRANKRGETST